MQIEHNNVVFKRHLKISKVKLFMLLIVREKSLALIRRSICL